MTGFVIQEHRQGSEVHWDLMLERGKVLATWRVGTKPQDWSAGPLGCEKLADHRLRYLEYEGPIGGERGEVQIVARGTYEAQEITEK